MDPLTVSASLDSLGTIREYVKQAATAAGLSRQRVYRLCLAVDEIANNVIEYGYGPSGASDQLTIEAQTQEAKLTIVLSDTAPPFDSRLRKESEEHAVIATPEERSVGGLGIHLALKAVDQFDYQSIDGQNKNIFVVHLNSPEEG